MVERNPEAVALSASIDEYNYFLTFEDSSTQNYSPALYERYIAPEISRCQQTLAVAGKRYVQHACGHLGVESLTPPETGDVSIAETRRIAGPDFGVIGGIEPVKLEPLTIETIPDFIDFLIDANAGGALFSPTLVRVPLEFLPPF